MLNLIKKIKRLNELERETALLRTKLLDPAEYVRALMDRDISWYDYHKLDDYLLYHNEAKHIVSTEAFSNEYNHYIADLIKFCGTDVKDIQQLKNIQFGIVCLETFKKRLESIENPLKKEMKEDLHSPI